MHAHNIFPLISPSAYYAARAEGVAVVQTLHNYRLLCPAGTLYRAGKVCEECTHDRFFTPALHNACYRGSYAGTAAVAAMILAHRAADTWSRTIDAFAVPSRFSRDLFVSAGFPANKTLVRPISQKTPVSRTSPANNSAVFVGRLVPEKGIVTLLDAWSRLENPVNCISWRRTLAPWCGICIEPPSRKVAWLDGS